MSGSYVPQNIDHTNGHAFLHDGDIFYSPNSSRHITIPKQTISPPYPFPARTTRIESFLEPRWWSEPYPYFPFVPLCPSFSGPAFGDLQNSSITFEDGVDSHSLNRHYIERWTQIEDGLIQAVYHLKREYVGMPPFLKPMAPSLLGFQKTFISFQGARRRVYISRNWFGMWMGLVAFLIAQAETSHPYGEQDNENWFTVLTRCGLPQSWLGTLQTSDAAILSSDCPRVGVILDFLSGECHQPKIEWFCHFNIPVWYPWQSSRSGSEYGTHPSPSTPITGCNKFYHSFTVVAIIAAEEAPRNDT